MNYLIARVSDVSQRKALPAQKKKLFDYAKKQQWDEGKDFVYIEYDETAFKENRTKFQELVIAPLKKEPQLVIVVFDKVDRYSRDSSSDDKAELMKLLRKGSIEMHFPSDMLYVSKDSPASELFRLDMNVALAGFYSASIRDNVKRRFDEMISNKTWIGKAPIGYENYVVEYDAGGKPIKKGIRFDPIRKEHILEGFRLRSLGWSYGAIAKDRKEAGLVSFKRKNQLHPTAPNKGKWEEIINNPFYIGKMRYMGNEYPHNYPILVEPWLWNKCQRVNRDRRVTRSKYQTKPFVFKQLKCAIEGCGCTITFDGPKGKGDYIYGRCTGYSGVHKANWINEKVLIQQVLDVLKKITVPKELMPTILAEVEKNHASEQDYYRDLKQSLQAEHDKLDQDIRELFEDRRKLDTRADIFESLVQHKTERQKAILEELDDLSAGNKGFVIGASYILELCSRAVELFEAETTTIEQKRYLIQTVLSNMKLNGSTLEFTVVEPFNAIVNMSESANWCG